MCECECVRVILRCFYIDTRVKQNTNLVALPQVQVQEVGAVAGQGANAIWSDVEAAKHFQNSQAVKQTKLLINYVSYLYP